MQSVQVSKKRSALILEHATGLEGFFPDMTRAGSKAIIPHDPYSTRVLRRHGYSVPSPIYTDYDWNKSTPFVAQKATAAMLVCEPRAFVLSDMGTGKTRAALYAWDYLYKKGIVRKMLVVAPLSTLNFTWLREITYNFPGYKVGIAHGTKSKREKVINDPQFDIVIINHHGVASSTHLLERLNFDVILIDEVAVFRNATTRMHKCMAKVATDMKYLWGMTGTPTPRAPTDAYGLLRLITPGNPWTKSFTYFRDMLMTKSGPFKWLPKPGATQRVYDMMQPAVRFTMNECVDIPPITYSERAVALSKRQLKGYEALRKHCVIHDEGMGVKAVNEAVLRLKLCQVACGVVYDVKKNPVDLEPVDRINVMVETILENNHKAIIFVPFTSLLDPLQKALEKAGIKVNLVHGGVNQTKRSQIFADFQDGAPGLEVILAHPGTMSHGLTLTAANLILWFAPIDDLEIYAQACARIARPGQTHHTQIIHLVGSPAERKIFRGLKTKEKQQGSLLELFDE